ncbi:MAG: TonB-dependent receptor [Ferruginibacter sp.]
MKYLFLLAVLFFYRTNTSAQYNFKAFIKDKDGHALESVTANIRALKRNAISNNDGIINFSNLPDSNFTIRFSYTGFISQEFFFIAADADSAFNIVLLPEENNLEEVIISSSRTNSRIEDLPTKVEVIGSEEVDEEAGTIPGNISSLLGDVAGIQNQRSSATTGNIDMRVQGLPGKYTQLLRDGLPLFGGYSGSFSILQIPPLDLKQVEIIKGSSSTLYGGGAIAGMINLVSKQPQLYKPEHSILINRTTLTENNIESWLSNRGNITGYTLSAGSTLQNVVDVNRDGFSDVPELRSFFVHPRLFLYPSVKSNISIGYQLTSENRIGGDMQVVNKKADNLHRFFIRNKTLRNTIDANLEHTMANNALLSIKGTGSIYNRDISTTDFGLNANQYAYFTEMSWLKRSKKHTIVAGINISGERFIKELPDSSAINNSNDNTIGFFVQDDWKRNDRFTVQSGLRLDRYNTNDPLVLPRISLLYKLDDHFTTRLGGGYGYKTPSVFNSELEEPQLQYVSLSPLAKIERSQGINWDINYKQRWDETSLTVNQTFYLTTINDPLILDTSNIVYQYKNAGKQLYTKGFETYVQLKIDELEAYLGYTYTIAKQLFDPVHLFVPLSARSKFAAVISNEFSSRIRACIEASYIGKQYLEDGSRSPAYFITAGMIRYDIKNVSIVFNCENLFDYRQTRKENIVLGSISKPVFKQLWAPIDGRVANLSVRFKW